MSTDTKPAAIETEKFITHPWWFMFRGGVMFAVGSVLAIFSVIAPEVQMLGTSSSWLPFAAFLILLVGILRCIDAFASIRKSLFLMNMQGSIVDLVSGFVILTSVGGKVDAFILIVAAYLLMQGVFRVVVSFVLEIPNPSSARIGGGISILLGLMAWMNWPFSDIWFLSFALSAEVANRGWALMFYAYSINKLQPISN